MPLSLGLASDSPQCGPQCTFLSLKRPLEAEPFGEEEIELLQALVPHVARALRLRAQKELGRLAPPSFLVTPQLRLLLANAGAEALVRASGGFRVRGGHLLRCIKGIRVSCGGLCGPCEPWEWETSRRGRCGGRSLNLFFWRRLVRARLGRGQVVLTVRNLLPPQELVPGRLRAIVKLTPAEARLVCSLWQTANLVTTAKDLEVSIHTAKRQLQNVYGKTGTSKQQALLKLLPVLHPVG
jgi:DNA-binding CsgD family transcriptional regulator